MHARVWSLWSTRRTAAVLLLLVIALLLAYALSGGSPAQARARAMRACGEFKVEGWPVSKVRVTHLTCEEARTMMVHYHETGHGLSCFTFSDDSPVSIQCKARVEVTHTGPSGPEHRLVEAVIAFSLPDCAAAGDCGI